MKHFTVFYDTGEIHSTGFCHESVLINHCPEGLNIIDIESRLFSDYVDIYDYYTVKPREMMSALLSKQILTADSIDSITLSPLPIPCTITVDEVSYEVTDGEFEFSVDTPGIYEIKATSFPYLETVWEVTAQ